MNCPRQGHMDTETKLSAAWKWGVGDYVGDFVSSFDVETWNMPVFDVDDR